MMGLLDAMIPKETQLEKQAFDNGQSLSKEEEKNLALEFQRTGDKLTYQKLLMSIRPMIEGEINKATNRNKHVPREVFGLDAYSRLPGYIKSYNPVTPKGTSVQLNTYLMSNIPGNLTNLAGEFKDGVYVDRTELQRLRKYRSAVKLAKMEFGPNPTDDQVLKHLDASLHSSYYDLKRTDVKSLVGDAEFGNEDGKKVLFKDQFEDKTKNYDAEQSFEIGYKDLKEHAQKQYGFTDEDLAIVGEVLDKKRSAASVALSYGISSSTVSNKVKRFREIAEKGNK